MNSSEEVYVHCLRLKFQFNYVPNLNWQSLSKIVSKSLKILLQSVLSKKRVQALKKQAPIRHALTLLLPKAKEESRICITGCAEACLFTFFYIG